MKVHRHGHSNTKKKISGNPYINSFGTTSTIELDVVAFKDQNPCHTKISDGEIYLCVTQSI